jgi:hypothetical protein
MRSAGRAPYLSDQQLTAAVEIIGAAARKL